MSDSTVTVTGVPATATESQISDFFSFCGRVATVTLSHESDSHSAKVEFAKPSAVKTALLLNDTELDGHKLAISASPEAIAASEKDSDAGTHSAGAGANGDISQEYKPRAAILAEYLSHGYVLSDKVVSQGLDLDKKHGISSRFTSFLTDLDSKYHVKDKAEATDKAYNISGHLQRGQSHAYKYFDQALKTDTGSKLHSYYTNIVSNVADVHAEARRLADIKQSQAASATSSTETPAAAAAPAEKS